MIVAIADNILSPLGVTSSENLEAVVRGDSRLFLHARVHGCDLHEPFVGSVFDELPSKEGYTAFEGLCICSAEKAIADAGLDAAASDCVFVISTTKGDIWKSPAESAQAIAGYFGNTNKSIVVSTACTSGVSAQVVASRLLRSGRYRTAVVIGADVQCPFIISGFQSFKALSQKPCKPFDAERDGLNVGEAAATLVLQNTSQSEGWLLLDGSIHNDANHISGPSRTAEGSYRCLMDMLRFVNPDELAFVSVHGTGTLYNDEMEALAVHRAELDAIPVSALKGYYGHTMGAAGLLETILSMHASDEGMILPTRGYDAQGTTYAVNISNEQRPTDRCAFIKLLSGFGGVNAAVAWKKNERATNACTKAEYETIEEVSFTSNDDVVSIYRAEVGDYPKFFKMDKLSRLGFVAIERLLREHKESIDNEKTIIILANRTASLKNDSDYQATIASPDNYYPSPALFVYTLPNIVTGELAIRHHLFGETVFYVLDAEQDLEALVETTMSATNAPTAIVGWLECPTAEEHVAHVRLIKKK